MSRHNFKSLDEALARVQALLDENRPQDATELLRTNGITSAALSNAYGVCLLRCGELQKALEVFHGLCMSTSVCFRRNASDLHLANYATTLLLKRNVSGCLRVLREVREPSHPAVARLQDVIRPWLRSLRWYQRVCLRLWDVVPSRPIVFTNQPGDLDGVRGPQSAPARSPRQNGG